MALRARGRQGVPTVKGAAKRLGSDRVGQGKRGVPLRSASGRAGCPCRLMFV